MDFLVIRLLVCLMRLPIWVEEQFFLWYVHLRAVLDDKGDVHGVCNAPSFVHSHWLFKTSNQECLLCPFFWKSETTRFIHAVSEQVDYLCTQYMAPQTARYIKEEKQLVQVSLASVRVSVPTKSNELSIYISMWVPFTLFTLLTLDPLLGFCRTIHSQQWIQKLVVPSRS